MNYTYRNWVSSSQEDTKFGWHYISINWILIYRKQNVVCLYSFKEKKKKHIVHVKDSMNVFRVSHSITSRENSENWIFSLKFSTKFQDKYIKCILCNNRKQASSRTSLQCTWTLFIFWILLRLGFRVCWILDF